jgi:MFS family permease
MARGLEAAGRPVEAVYLGGIFPFARPGRRFARLADLLDWLRSDQHRVNGLRAAGLDTDELDAEQLKLLVDNRRTGTREAERYFGRLYAEGGTRLNAPVISVAGERDPATEYYQERFREWHLLSDTAAGVVIDEAAHFYLRYRAAELADILTVHRAISSGDTGALARADGSTWWLQGVSSGAPQGAGEPAPAGPRPSMKRFGAVGAGQLVSMVGSALTEFAIPIWVYTTTGSILSLALFAVIGLVPGLVAAPLAGAIVDRFDRRRVMLCGDVAAGGAQLVLGLLLWTGTLRVWHIYPLLALLSVALIFQRTAYASSIPQLVPKRFLGHANGVVQLATGTAQLIVPLVAVGLVATIGLEGILAIDVASYAVATVVLVLVRFPATMAWKRRESLVEEIRGGWRYAWGTKGFRAMLLYFALLNLFLSPLFLLITPLVLTFATITDVGQVAFAGGLGAFVGGVTMTLWGGPRRRRMRGVLLCTLVLGLFCMITGLRQDLITIALGAFGMSFWLAMLNGVYATIIQVKVSQRFHGRVIALNMLVAWSTVPIGFALVAPTGVGLVGDDIGLLYVLFAAAIAVVVLIASRTSSLSRFDVDVPDALPDDLIGAQMIGGRIRVDQ